MPKRIPAAALAATLAAATLVPAAQRDLGTGEQLRNVEVMDPSMRLADARRYMVTFNEALGMECRDCHVLRDFASDERPLKLVARQMMKMQAEMNARWFPDQGELVTCWTCHRGERMPPAGSGLGAAGADSLLERMNVGSGE